MICRIYDVPGGTLEQYDEVDQKMAEKMGKEAPEGVHAHIAGATDDGFRVIEVWDSSEHAERYDQEAELGEAMQEAGVPEPTITEFEVHSLDWLRAPGR
jgi:methionine-rich copper-binding protein CopC